MKNLILTIITILSISAYGQKAMYHADVSEVNSFKFLKQITKKNIDLNKYLISRNFNKINNIIDTVGTCIDSTNIYQLNRNVLVVHFVDCSDSVSRIWDYYDFCYWENIHENSVNPSQEHMDINYRKYRITKENQFDIAYLFVPQGQKIYDGQR